MGHEQKFLYYEIKNNIHNLVRASETLFRRNDLGKGKQN